MATPHITGLIAYFISVNGNISPAAMIKLIQDDAQKNALSNMETGTCLIVGEDRI